VHTSLGALTTVLASSGSSSKSSGGNYFLLILIAGFALLYFLFLRPQRAKQRAAAAKARKAVVGDEVTTTAGLIATVVAIDDDALTLEVAPGVQCRYLPAAILRVNTVHEDEVEAEPTRAGEDLHASTHEVIEAPQATTDQDPPDDQPGESASA
jgi:preprotein translocase subunit YajC